MPLNYWVSCGHPSTIRCSRRRYCAPTAPFSRRQRYSLKVIHCYISSPSKLRYDILPPSLLRSQCYISTPSLIVLSPPVASVTLPLLLMPPSLLASTARTSRRHTLTLIHCKIQSAASCYFHWNLLPKSLFALPLLRPPSSAIRFHCDVNRRHIHRPHRFDVI